MPLPDGASGTPPAAIVAALLVTGGTAAIVGVTANEAPDVRAPIVGAGANSTLAQPSAANASAETPETVIVNGSMPEAPDRPPENISTTPNASSNLSETVEEARNRTENRTRNASAATNNSTSEPGNATEEIPEEPREVTLGGSVRAYPDTNASYTGRYYVNVTLPERDIHRPGLPGYRIELVDERTNRTLGNATTGPNGTYNITVRHAELGPLELRAVADPPDANETTSALLPTRVVAPVRDVEVGGQQTCVLTGAGNVDCWGGTEAGEGVWAPTEQWSGYGIRGRPVNFYPADAIEVSADYDHVCYLNATGNVDCRGPASSSNDMIVSNEVRDYNGSDAVTVDTDAFEACVATEDGEAWCWGSDFGAPSRLGVEGFVVDIAVGQHHRCALTDDGNVTCEEGHGGDLVQGYEGGDAVSVAAAGRHTCVRTEANASQCWGETGDALLNRTADVAQLAPGDDDTCLRLVDASVVCAGRDRYNETRSPDGEAVEISAGGEHTCLLRETSRVHCWGWNQLGEALDYPHQLWPIRFHEQGPDSHAQP